MNAGLLKLAAAEYFNEGFVYAEVQRIIDNTDPDAREAAREALAPRRTIPDGCFVWINYLVWLERVMEIARVPLTAAEVDGLLVLKRERTRFQAAHPPCFKCGMPNEPHALNCRECMEEIHR